MLKLQLLGAPSICDDGGEIHLPSQKAQALLYYLAAEHERSFARGQIIAVLWEDSSEREGRNSLSTVLSRVRQSLPLFPLRVEGDTLAWQPSPDIDVDLHQFQANLATPRPTARTGEAPNRSEPDLDRLERAVALYRGPFLDGFNIRGSESFDEWLRLERERWQLRWLNALERLIDGYARAGRWQPAIDYARRAVTADQLQERFHRTLMRLHYQAGERAAALAQFRLCREVLERELGVGPDEETTSLYQAIAEGRLERLAPSPAPSTPPVAPASRGPQRLAARLASARRRSFVGRADELARFAQLIAEDPPPDAVLYVYGPGGVGKSTLLAEFARVAGEAGVPSLMLDGRNIQPSPDGLLNALRELTGFEDPLGSLPERHVMLLDTYEVLAPIDSWVRDQLLPQIPERAMVVLASRSAPAAGWRVDPAWQEMMSVIQLGNLSEDEAADYLERRNIPHDQRSAVLRFTRCYPLALSLAAEVLIQRPGSMFDDSAAPDIVRVLLERFVAGVPSSAHRAALEACSQVRVLTDSLLAALLDMADTHELFEWLRSLSFISTGPRGIFPHDLAREALTADVHWRNPSWHAELHRRARAFYMAEFARPSDRAQYMALLDLIYLHDHPMLRSIFTWNEIGGVVEDAPQVTDWPALTEMVRRHEGDESARIAGAWFARQPKGVTVFRDGTGAVTGFLMYVTLRPDCADIIAADPCAATIQRYIAAQPPLPDGGFAVISRFWMDRENYQAVSPTQGMIFVASIRYLLTTPRLAISFHVIAQPELWDPSMRHVLFYREPAADFVVSERHYGVYVHDWRAQPPQAWLEALAARETVD